ncbi:MAG: radical SAM protein [Bacteroidales bacterium]|nr:radical SAM protein [Bacteroidales bacterium]
MATFLFDRLVFGPVQSRRLGASLGINLLPADSKYCNFDCIYCECGRNAAGSNIKEHPLPARKDVAAALERKLAGMQASGQLPDAITFAGNGEPTIHPDFAGIVDDVIALRNRYAPPSKISVLSNATMLHRPEVAEALGKTDMPVLKLDSAIDATVRLLNHPAKAVPVRKLIARLKAFNGRCVIQTMFLHGTCNGQPVNNMLPEELDAWEKAVSDIRPKQLMIYTIARDTPVNTLYKAPEETLRLIAKRMEKYGIPVQISL